MIFPFVAVEGQENIKKALLLNIINKKIGGVLINGEKGTAKSTLVRGLSEIFSEIKVVNLPLNITEDNLIGSIDIEKTLKSGKKIFQPGVLKKCHNNILYVDEVNLLGDSIVSCILECASREMNYIEREGISFSHECRFILVGTMNPEEGDLRPQLLDKFGLYVNAQGTENIVERVNIVKKRLEFEKDPESFCSQYKEEEELLREKIKNASVRVTKIKVSEQITNIGVKIVEEANTSGNRAEIILMETAKAIAALDGRTYLNIDDLKEAAAYVLPHRMNRKNEQIPQNEQDSGNKNEENSQDNKNKEDKSNQKNEQQDPPQSQMPDLDQNNNKNNEDLSNDSDDSHENENHENSSEDSSQNEQNNPADEDFDIGEIFKVKEFLLDNVADCKKRTGTGKRCKTRSGSLQGRYVKSTVPKGKIRDFAFDATIRAAAPYQTGNKNGLMISIKKEHIRVKKREKRTGATILFVVDSSGSMGVKKRMETVKGAIMSLLKDAYEKRDRVGMVSFRRDRAEEILPVTRSIDLAQKKLKKITTGGKTPLAEGIKKAHTIIKNELRKDKESIPLIVLLSDGKANFSATEKDPVTESLEVARKIKDDSIRAIVVDTEEGFIKLEMAKTLSEAMDAEYYRLENLKSEDMLNLIKNKI
ncbi:magnesium chelatase subunit D family protein [Fusobacterium sp.]|uniref:magnesium chelatase subunit D family protein n=1 Tax=Fusobacterium sp. TaxID=68766 RepID=UPI00396CB288